MTIIEKLSFAAQLSEEKKYKEAIGLFSDLLNHEDIDPFEIYLQLGGCYQFQGDHTKAYEFFHKASTIEPSNELASLGLYIALVELDRSAEAIEELERFSLRYPLRFYQVSVNELLKGLQNGYGTKYKDKIFRIAERHNILSVPGQASE